MRSSQRRWLDPETAADMGKLDPAAIKLVREQAWPDVTNADELHDALHAMGVITAEEGDRGRWTRWLDDLDSARHAPTRLIRRRRTGPQPHLLDLRGMPAAGPGRLSTRDRSIRPSPRRADKAAKIWQREAGRSPISCVVACRAWARSRRAIWRSRWR